MNSQYRALDRIIDLAAGAFGGGEVFFSAIDSAMRRKEFCDCLMAKIPPQARHIVVSGKFGLAFRNRYHRLFDHIVLASGGLRGRRKQPTLYGQAIGGKEWVFVDDSFYSGATRDAIADRLAEQGSRIARTVVLYDGSRIHDDTVTSLIRYHGR